MKKIETDQAAFATALTADEYAEYHAETFAHIQSVRYKLRYVCEELMHRARAHDASKLKEPEASGFHRIGVKLAGVTYGSDEYKEVLASLKPVLDHHYANNSHHPEHYEKGIRGMDLFDLMEMFVDWLAGTERHDDGDIFRSIEINESRFGIPPELSDIFRNTIQRW